MHEINKSEAVRLGILGLGVMGKNHFRVASLLNNFEVVAVFDPNKEALKQLKTEKKVLKTSKIQEVIELCDAVIISAPTQFHLALIENISHKIKNIFVEKPMVGSHKEAIELGRLCEDRAINLQVGFIERFNPTVVALKKVFATEKNIIHLDFVRANKVGRIQDVDVVMDLMIHDIDLALYLNGPVQQLSAHSKSGDGLSEFCIATLVHENNTISRLLSSKVTNKKIRSIEATSDESFIECDLLRKEVFVSRAESPANYIDGYYKIEGTRSVIEVGYQEALLSELQAFASLCNKEENDVPNYQDGLNALNIATLISKKIYQTEKGD